MKTFFKIACLGALMSASVAYAAPYSLLSPMMKKNTSHHEVSFLKNLFGGGDQQAAPPPVAQKAPEPEISEEEFQAATEVYENNKFYINPISYKMYIPNGWENVGDDISEAPDLNSRLLQTVESFRGPTVLGGQRPTIKIEAMILNHEILAEHWLKNYIFKSGFTLAGDVEATNQSEAEAKIVYVKGPLSLTAYLRAMIVQNRLFLIRYDAPSNLAPKDYKIGEKTVTDFEFKNAKIGSAEEIIEFSFSNRLKFDYPNSWLIKNHVLSDVNKSKAELHNVGKNGDLLGLIQLQSYRTSKQSLSEILFDLTNGLRNDRKIKPVKLISSAPLSANLNFDLAFIERYNVSLNDRLTSEYELWVAILNEENWLNVVYLLTPSKDVNYYEWARNTRTFEILLSSIK